MSSLYRSLLRLASLVVVIAALSSCGDDDGYYAQCRYQPGLCAGGVGALCGSNLDCAGGSYCCREPKECGGGMCTFTCRSDFDCPISTACEHEMCLFVCASDFDCAVGQHCGHKNKVCEW